MKVIKNSDYVELVNNSREPRATQLEAKRIAYDEMGNTINERELLATIKCNDVICYYYEETSMITCIN